MTHDEIRAARERYGAEMSNCRTASEWNETGRRWELVWRERWQARRDGIRLERAGEIALLVIGILFVIVALRLVSAM